MKINKVLLLLFFGIIVAGFSFLYKIVKKDKPIKCAAFAARVAIFQPINHPALDEIVQACVTTLNQGPSQYDCTIYNANGNQILLQAQAAEIVQADYDLIIPVGVGCSVAIKQAASKQQSRTPIVFTAIDDPEKLDLQGKYMTGVIDQTNYSKQVDLLLQLKPSIKKVLLVYDVAQGSGLEKDKDALSALFSARGIALKAVEIFTISELQQKVTGLLNDCDVVMILKDNVIVSGIDSLVSLCQRYHVPLLATDLNSGQKGAVLAFGFYEAESGIAAAEQGLLILQQGIVPSHLPVRALTGTYMVINPEQVAAQGLDYLDLTTLAIEGVIIAGRDTHV